MHPCKEHATKSLPNNYYILDPCIPTTLFILISCIIRVWHDGKHQVHFKLYFTSNKQEPQYIKRKCRGCLRGEWGQRASPNLLSPSRTAVSFLGRAPRLSEQDMKKLISCPQTCPGRFPLSLRLSPTSTTSTWDLCSQKPMNVSRPEKTLASSFSCGIHYSVLRRPDSVHHLSGCGGLWQRLTEKQILIELTYPEIHLENEVSMLTFFISEDFNKKWFLNKNCNAIASTNYPCFSYPLVTSVFIYLFIYWEVVEHNALESAFVIRRMGPCLNPVSTRIVLRKSIPLKRHSWFRKIMCTSLNTQKSFLHEKYRRYISKYQSVWNDGQLIANASLF